MFRWQKRLALLHQELGTIALFDRVHDYATDPAPADHRAYELRQIRRSQIMAEISQLNPSRLENQKYARVSSAVLFLSAVVYATLHYLLR